MLLSVFYYIIYLFTIVIALSIGGALYSALKKITVTPKTQIFHLLVTILYLQLSFSTFNTIKVNVKDIYSHPSLQYSGILSTEHYTRIQGVVTNRHVQGLRLWSGYGLFRRMTGMGVEQKGRGMTGVGGMPASVVAR